MTTIALPRVRPWGVSMPYGADVISADEAAVREIYRAHYGMLAGWCNKLVGDRDLAHDVATEAFVRLLAHWGDVAEPRAWLYTAAANIIRDHWRKRGREQVAYGKVGHDIETGAEPDLARDLSVRAAVQALPDRLRVSVMLHYFADLSIAQVATQLGKSEGAVKRDLWDARQRLAASLEGAR
ncbi:RNA polymerase ECF sigma factor [Nostocoides australiense Ben110]|uniref:RNA polymerase ECF sigma factor n=2 Tax=Nostocoides australiense TaxID=99480 RepID=W6JTD2_9MICO|nr:RNA polymerase ECF sigma factor [Tetrasphaera australiensis Ben110]